MAEPRPLTQTPAAKLDWSRPGTPIAEEFGDIYFSTDGGLAETRTVFLEGCGLPDGWENQPVFTIAELGFGSGLNFLATWQRWSQTAKANQRLHFVSIEKFPFDKAQLKQALSAWPELADLSAQLVRKWPGRIKGFHRLHFGSVTLTLIHDEVTNALSQVGTLKAQAWFLDGFSPAANPDMWSAEVMQAIAASTTPGAKLATFSVAGSVRDALSKAGFLVRKMPGFGRKRHRLEADFPGQPSKSSMPIDKALIVGAGIAGKSLATALSRRQIPFQIIDNESHPAASRNPAAMIKPRFDLQDRPESRFFLSAFRYALNSYPDDAILHRGIRQIPKSHAEMQRFQKLVSQAPLGESGLIWKDDALWIADAVVVNPANVYPELEVVRKTFEAKQATSDFSHVFLAAGYGIRQLAPELAFRYSRGQLSWAKPILDHPIAYGGYALKIEGDCLVGATHDRLDDQDPFLVKPEDDEKNLSALADISGLEVSAIDRPSRASIRVTSRDTLPRLLDLGQNPSGQKQWVISGLGSRGFSFAPLLAEILLSKICNEVGAVDSRLDATFSDLSRLS